MRLNGLIQPFINSEEFNKISQDIKKDKYPLGIFGLSESSRAYMIYTMYEENEKTFLVLTNSDVEAKNLYEDLLMFTSNVYYFPVKEVVFYNIDAISGDLRWERLKVIKQMLGRGKKIIVTSIETLASRYVPVDLFKKYSFKISLGQSIDEEKLQMQLVQSGYERVDIVDGKGQFSVRGGIVDIYPTISEMPYRIELFGDEIDSIRTFNVESQRSIEKVKNIDIFPAKEVILTKDNIELGYKNIEQDLKIITNNLKKSKKFEAEKRIKETVNANLELLKESWNFKNIDSYIPYFYNKMSNFLDYFRDCYVVMDDVQRCKGKLESVYFEFEDNYKNFLERGDVLPRQLELLEEHKRVNERLENSNLITLNSISKSTSSFSPRSIVSLSQITLNSYQGNLELLINDIKEKKSRGFKIVILSGTRPRGKRLVDTLRDYEIESVYKDKIDFIDNSEVVVTFGTQLKGYEFPELKLSIISDKEVFGKSKRKIKRKKAKGVGKIKSFTELKPGDYVVHVNHGIGVYKGIKQLEVDDYKKDYLELSYNSGDKLYVPVEQLDLVQKYIGTEGKKPKVNKLGGNEWNKAKTKVRNSINQIAEDLVKLYAARAEVKGYSYSKDTVWQKQFEDEFPYQETPDQIVAIEEIKRDMESNKPMDRLLCGDVGYGKTEVAMRAAFKAVMDGKQVAFLVPTTILAEQHYNNFIQRFSDFPVSIDMVSRFRTAAQQRATIKSVKEGNVDILIGTHRILQKDIKFKDLGLLIVDEEQRFGVTHKEKIKNLKKNIDVLTLTATPIPRTLHMSLTGVRGISVIETPPEERYPVQTYVVEYNDQLIRDAIMREINRGGQVYFVYNRVESIREMANYVQELIPEAKVTIAHGQMTERELEKVMVDFMKNNYNILICTTIIETGIDIPNVNTMVMYDADKMGLSQLYQLRGRVGRTNRIAYAYLTYRKDKMLTEVAEKRMKAIKEFTELGSGFKIAMRDLEIRGAGNIMGSAQHGHMAAIGYDLYCRMLEDTIKIIRGEIAKEPVETVVEIKIDAFIPSTYIESEVQKIEVYKKIASIDSYEDMMEVQEELIDRFSDIPASVNNLMQISYIRGIARQLGIVEIKDRKKEVEMIFENKERITKELVSSVLKKYSRQIIFKYGEKPVIAYQFKQSKRENILEILKEFLQYIVNIVEPK